MRSLTEIPQKLTRNFRSSEQQKDLDSTLSRHVTHAKSQICEFTSHHTESATSHSQSQKQVTDGLTSHVETINTSLIQNSEKERSIVEDSHQQHEQRTQQLHSDTMDFHLSASRLVAAVKVMTSSDVVAWLTEAEGRSHWSYPRS